MEEGIVLSYEAPTLLYEVFELLATKATTVKDTELLLINESMTSSVTIAFKNKKLTLLVRDKFSGGRNSSESEHSSSVKIESPAKYKGLTITIPKNKDESPKIIAKPGTLDNKSLESAKKDLVPALDFVEQNARFLNVFWKSDEKEWNQKRALKQLVNHNDEIVKITVSDKELERKLKEKIDGRKRNN